ncbi:hypothetical protein GSI_01711 [Ganoderma sinense ZZ0214-1]|uniref:Uncharacterized protein n=1 Tax=Ganoderma sinense ZZ0214-1 TaxID=1077348 RepID=A0A2G8SQK5_9APHY|nr:hypothetical protein GSI_01711 [Ganoderma sinense ZZ0214-1]
MPTTAATICSMLDGQPHAASTYAEATPFVGSFSEIRMGTYPTVQGAMRAAFVKMRKNTCHG